MADVPNSYKDAYWTDLASQAEAKTGIPPGFLKSIVLNGEKSNNNQVSEAGARTPFQITPPTQKLILDKYGIDTSLSPENAAEGAALLLKESLQRNKGDIALAAAEYHGGTNRANWGPKTTAYTQRVTQGVEATKVDSISKDLDNWLAGQPTSADAQVDQVKQIGATRDAALNAPAPTQNSPTTPDVSGIVDDMKQWQANKQQEKAPQPDLGIIGGLKEAITGTQRATPESQTLPEWTGMPELNELSMASAKTGLGTIFAAPDEIVQVIKANFPDTQIRRDEKGNYIIKSSVDGADYVIPPGLTMGDIPRVVGGLAALTPSGRAISTLGMTGAKGLAAQAVTGGAAMAATQAAIEGTQAATGGDFSGKDVAMAGLLGAVFPPAIQGVEAVGGAIASPLKSALGRVMGGAKQEAAPVASSVPNQAAGKPYGEQEPTIMGATGEYTAPKATTVAEGAPSANPIAEATHSAKSVTPMAASELDATARKAAGGGLGSEKATQNLAEQVLPDAKTVQSAKDLGIEKYIQPDHVSTNQAYIELAQVIKSVPGSQARKAELEGLEQVAKRADDLITELGGTDDLSNVSQRIKENLQKTQSALDKKADSLYAELKAGIPSQTVADASNVVKFVQQQAVDLGGVKNLSPLEKNILSKLAPEGQPLTKEGFTSGAYLKPSANPRLKQPTYALLDSVRKDIGAAARMSGPFKDADTGLAKKLYNLISADQEAVAEAQGLGKLFKTAKETVRVRKGVEDDLIALFGKAIEGSIVGDLSGAVNVLAKGDTSKFIKLIKSVPEDMRQQLVASGLNTAFGKSAKQGSLNFNSYTKWYEGLVKNQQAYTALMTNLPPQARKSLSDLYRVSKGISRSTSQRITTGRISEGVKRLEGADTLAGKIYEAARYDIPANTAGIAAAAVTTPVVGPVGGSAVGLFIRNALSKGAKKPGMEAADALLTSPEFQETVNRAAQGQAKPAAEKLAKSKVFSDFVFKIGNPHELSNRERWILQALEANNSNHKQANSR